MKCALVVMLLKGERHAVQAIPFPPSKMSLKAAFARMGGDGREAGGAKRKTAPPVIDVDSSGDEAAPPRNSAVARKDAAAHPASPKRARNGATAGSPLDAGAPSALSPLAAELAVVQHVALAHNDAGVFAIAPPAFDISSAFTQRAPRVIKKDPDLDLVLFKPFMSAAGRTALYRYLLEELPWYRVKYTVRGVSFAAFGVGEPQFLSWQATERRTFTR